MKWKVPVLTALVALATSGEGRCGAPSPLDSPSPVWGAVLVSTGGLLR